MVFCYKEMEEKVLPHFNGGEKELHAKMYVDNHNKILLGRLEPGATIGLHTHDTSSEVIYVLEGCGKVLYDGSYEKVEAGICHYCPRGHAHSLINDSEADLVFFAVVPMA